MKNININQSITNLSLVSRYGIIFGMAIFLGKLFWWLTNPMGYHIYNSQISSSYKSDRLAQGIVNLAPFGITIEEKAPQPAIADEVKLVGVYAGGIHNSIAFIQVNNSSQIVQVGDNILDAQLKVINPQSIILNSKNQDITIKLTAGANSGGDHPHGSNNRLPSDNQNNKSGYIPNNNQTPQAQNTSQTDMQQQGINNNNDNSQENNIEAIAEKRRKMIEAFQRQNNAADNNQ
jgi:hypothetical protein